MAPATIFMGVGRIAQVNGNGTEYFLSDALGSVRQLASSSGSITYARAYDPYGVVTTTTGTSSTVYGYTAESYDTYIKLIYLRSRYFASNTGRFLTRDMWGGDANSPMSFNRWMYVAGNPINYTDPSGNIREDMNEAKAALDIVQELQKYQINIVVDWGYVDQNSGALIGVLPLKPASLQLYLSLYGSNCGKWENGRWDLNELYIIKGAVLNLNAAMNKKMSSFIGPVSISKGPTNACNNARGCTTLGHIDLIDNNRKPTMKPGSDLSQYYVRALSKDLNFDQWTVVHELGHAWDARSWAQNRGSLWLKLVINTGGWFGPALGCDADHRSPGCNNSLYHYRDKPAKGSDSNFNPGEDFAESVAAYVFPVEAQQAIQGYQGTKYENYLYYSAYAKTKRWMFINNLINGIIK